MNIKDDIKLAPNLITITRILLLPVFMIMYFFVGRIYSFALIALITLTDVVDGYVARKCNMISQLGQILDPLADKLIQISVVLCLYIDNVVPLWFVIILLVKEFCMVLASGVLYKKNNLNISAKWFGKMSTVVFYVSMTFIFIFGNNYPRVTNVLLVVAACTLLFSFVRYTIIFIRIIRTKV